MTSPSLVMVGSYDYGLVILSVLISMLAASATLALAGRVNAARGMARLPWLIGGAMASGIGTWSMHFTAMRAFNLPVEVLYDWPTVLLSLLPAILASAAALLVVSRRETKSLRTLAGGILMGGGIAALHYTGMASMRMPAMCHYSPALVTLSVLLAMLVSLLPLSLKFLSWEEASRWGWRMAVSIFMLGAANPVMHFTGMAAATFTRSQVVPDLSNAISISAIGVRVFAIAPMMVLTGALVVSLVDQLHKSLGQLRALAARLQVIREEERSRVAREIHDELGQALTAIKIDLSSLTHELAPDKKQWSEPVLELVDQTIQSVRRISTELRPGILDDLGLVAAIEWAAKEFEARTGTKCRLDLPEAGFGVEQEHATALFRIFQETLTNVTRHANATEVNVRLAREDGTLTMEIQDNGKGVSEDQFSAANSLGILGMRERALLLGGELAIRSAPGKGVTVRVHIPEVKCK